MEASHAGLRLARVGTVLVAALSTAWTAAAGADLQVGTAYHLVSGRGADLVPDAGVPSTAAAWPPSACARAATGRRRPPDALARLCEGTEHDRSLWTLGVRLLGEGALVEFVERVVPKKVSLAGHFMTFWHDRLDTSANVSAVDVLGYDLQRHCRGLSAKDWVVDVGGHLGLASLLARRLSPAVSLLILEPSPWNYFLLRLNLMQSGITNRVVTVHAAVDAAPGTMMGKHSFAFSFMSCVGHKGFCRHRDESQKNFTAAVTTLGALAWRFHITNIALLKLDCEGCEWAVARTGMGGDVGIPARAWVGELHLLCQHQEWWLPLRFLRPCFPRALSVEEISEMWHFFCQTWTFVGACRNRMAPMVPAVLSGQVSGWLA
mmetsp:Transcript_117946/g.333609  ORF Transcript_117946/g.333609 Transcript_117946/m.333609 type:complete len:376 (+) Transcript_117946:89-1216(+)